MEKFKVASEETWDIKFEDKYYTVIFTTNYNTDWEETVVMDEEGEVVNGDLANKLIDFITEE